jgi:predicted nucleic acid-binding protein
MVIIDSNVLIEISRNNKRVIEKCEKIGVENLCLTPVSVAEFLNGVHDKAAFQKAEKMLNKFRLIDFEAGVGAIFLSLTKKFTLSHRPAVPDLLIASIAVYYTLR